ncbi:MAG: hypothetical protein ACFFBH_15455 [Promethearchaeota archaeon]
MEKKSSNESKKNIKEKSKMELKQKMVVYKEELIAMLEQLPDDMGLVEIQKVILQKSLPSILEAPKKEQKEIQKLAKISRELEQIIKKAELNPKYLQEMIPAKEVRRNINYRNYGMI